VRTAIQKVGNFVAVLLQISSSISAKNYQNKMWFDKIIAKIKGAIFLAHSVVHKNNQF